MSKGITNFDDVIDSRDIIDRIAELERDNDDMALSEDDALELAALHKLQEAAEGYAPDWQYGSQLIRESYFEEEMDNMVEQCYDLPKSLPFWMHITYDYAALKQDYTAVDFDGVTYLVR